MTDDTTPLTTDQERVARAFLEILSDAELVLLFPLRKQRASIPARFAALIGEEVDSRAPKVRSDAT